jgi:hypothetical protein
MSRRTYYTLIDLSSERKKGRSLTLFRFAVDRFVSVAVALERFDRSQVVNRGR